ncbi:MAG TPA: hypothetical protein H9686_02220 [Firmicutes bacterium]|nr:hypothetical protein [Bacillota bacterium]
MEKAKTLVIDTAVKNGNGELSGVKILGLTSAEWIKLRLKRCFGNIVFSRGLKGDVTVPWDKPLLFDDDTVLRRDTFAYVEEKLRLWTLAEMRAAGVILRGSCIYADGTVTYESGAEIFSPCVITGNSHISAGASVQPYCFLKDCFVGGGTTVRSTFADNARIGARCEIGPFACLRPGSVVGDGCRVGDFVEVKNSSLGDGVKAAHLAYIGDAAVGGGTNVGCGTVFANYDGREKHRTTVGRNCFLGCNVNLVAPLTLGDGVFVAAGTTVTDDAGENSFVIGRSRQQTKRKKEKDGGG